MRYFKFLQIFIALLSLSSCKKEAEVKPKDYPYVITNSPIVNHDGAEFIADITNLGNYEILKYGFVWSKKSKPTIQDNIMLFDKEPKKRIYSYNVNSGLVQGHIYYVRAYILTEQYEVYGNMKSFNSLGSLPPIISNFTPKYGPIGTQVIIEGENFALSKTENIVKFGEINAIIDSASTNVLLVRVPTITKPEKVYISVETSGYSTTFLDENFDMWFPWIRKSDFPGTYLHSTNNFEINGKIYICGGLETGEFQIMKEFWEYNPTTDIWIRKPDFPGEARYNAIAFSCNGKGYYGLGTTYSVDYKDYVVDLWEYDPDTEQWTQKTDFPGIPVIYSKSFVSKNKAYIGPGYFWKDSWSSFINNLWEYDPLNNKWQQKKDFPGSERYIELAIGTKDYGYMGLGNDGSYLNDFYKYDPNKDTWELAGYYPGKGNNEIASFFIDEKLYLGMGSNNSIDSYADFWEFDLINNNWKEMNSCPTKLSPSLSFTINNKGYVGYGWYDLSSNDISYGRVLYEFDPSKN
jgi:N-acetylneuraminic acid mutarotase